MENKTTPEQELQQEIEYALKHFVDKDNLIKYILSSAKTYHYSKLLIEIENSEKCKQTQK